MDRHDLVIVGAGPVGMALALALKDAGLDILLVDARARGAARHDPRVLALAHGTRLTLERLGVWTQLRATPIETTEKWLAGGMAHAVTSGAFCVSSNRSEAVSGTTMGGAGWIADPDGTMLAVTSAVQPVIVADLDLEVARTAKSTYPRYVER